MSQPFLGQLLLVPYNFAPKGWSFCNGQTLAISQNTALFSLLGTTYGGNGVNTFLLPDLRGRVPISSGQGPGLQSYVIGQVGGSESENLAIAEMAAHTHALQGTISAANATKPGLTSATVLATSGIPMYSTGTTLDAPLAAGVIGNSSGGQAHENRPPFLVMSWIIALVGVFPSRS